MLFGLDPTVTAVSTLLIGVTVVVLGGSAMLRGRASYPMKRRPAATGRRGRRRPFTVDIHGHVFTPEAEAIASQMADAGAAAMARYTTDATTR